MIGMKTGRTGGEQLLVLWTWLLEGYVPVAHMVADLDELEAFASNELGDAPGGRTRQAGMQFEGRVAA